MLADWSASRETVAETSRVPPPFPPTVLTGAPGPGRPATGRRAAYGL
jgi:hypothetical protein